MVTDYATVMAIAGAAALASPVGGLVALWSRPTTLFMSIALGFAGGVLLATICFSMLPQALQLGSLPIAVTGFSPGFLAMYAFDLLVHHGRLAGEESKQHRQVERFYRRRRVRRGEVTVLAGETSVEELIEGVSIGVGTAIKPGLGLLIGLAIVIDNLSEALGIGEIIRAEQGERQPQTRRILGWTGLIGAAVLVSALAGWFFLRGLSGPVLAFLLSLGGGGMFYLTLTNFVPQAEELHYQQSAALSIGFGFMFIFVLSGFL